MPQFTVITQQEFANKAWQPYSSYAFAARAHMLPVAASELGKLVPVMPLAFVPAEQTFQLVVVTSLLPDTNLFVTPDGRWAGEYVPAALRGYPFQLVKPQDREDSVLCINESSGLVVEAGLGEPFFDGEGKPSKPVQNVVDFLAQVERDRVITQNAVDALQAAGLIQPWPLSIQQGQQMLPVNGLFSIDEAALNVLDADMLHALRGKGALAIAYAQLFSMSRLSVLDKLRAMHARAQVQAAGANADLAVPGGFNLSRDDGILKFS